MIEGINFDRHGLSFGRGSIRIAALAVSFFVCYNATHRQFNTYEPNVRFGTREKAFMASRRTAICLLAIGISAIASIGSASALDYPTRPVRWVVGYPPGGATDILARLIGQRLSERLGQQFVIENKPGAGNNIATESVINAEPDGYTMLLVNPANYINTSLYANLKFNLPRDIAPVAAFNRVPNGMTGNKEV